MTGERGSLRRLLPVGLLVLLALLPLGFEQYKLYVASLTLVYLVMAIGLNLTLGYAGQISLAHGAFMAFGAYAVAILGQRGLPFELGLGLGAALGFGWGLLVGFPALKVKHHFLAMVTLGFNIMVFLVLRNWESLTGGSFGISGIARPAWGPLSVPVRPRVLRLHAGLGGGGRGLGVLDPGVPLGAGVPGDPRERDAGRGARRELAELQAHGLRHRRRLRGDRRGVSSPRSSDTSTPAPSRSTGRSSS